MRIRDLQFGVVIAGVRALTIGLKLAVSVLITRTLSLSDLGVYGLVAGALTVSTVLLGLGFISQIGRDLVTEPRERVTHSLVYYWRWLPALYTAFGVAALTIGGPSLRDLTWLVLGVALLEHLAQDAFILLIQMKRSLLANLSLMVRALGPVMGLLFPLAFGETSSLGAVFYGWLLGAFCAVGMFGVVTRGWPWVKALGQDWKPKALVSHVRANSRIYVADVSNMGSQYSDRYLVSALFGLEISGLYILFFSAANAAYNLVNQSIMAGFRPRLIEIYARSGKQAHWRELIECGRTTLLFAFPVFGGTFLAIWAFLPLLKEPLASRYLPLLVMMLCAMWLRLGADVGAYGLFSRRYDTQYAATYAGAWLASVSVMVLLLSAWTSIYMVAAGQCLTMFTLMWWRYRILRAPEPC